MEYAVTEAVRIRAASNYRELEELYPRKRHLRSMLRDAAVFTLSIFSKRSLPGNWIRFPCYHHVFDDERSGFERHLRFFKKKGDFISVDEAVDILSSGKMLKGRYFCITFDDGFKNCATNALPILVENRCSAVFFVSTDYIGRDIEMDEDGVREFFSVCVDAYPRPVEFLSWDDCRTLIGSGMAIGSHASSHRPFNRLTDDEIRSEVMRSKQKIENELGVDCRHFGCPWGVPGRDYRRDVVPVIVKEAGYGSFFTGVRGANFNRADPFEIRRDGMLAKWGDYQLRYFFSR